MTTLPSTNKALDRPNTLPVVWCVTAITHSSRDTRSELDRNLLLVSTDQQRPASEGGSFEK